MYIEKEFISQFFFKTEREKMTESKFESLPPLVKTKIISEIYFFVTGSTSPTETTTSTTEKNVDNGTQLQTIDEQCHVLGEEKHTVTRGRTMSLRTRRKGQARGGVHARH